MNIACSINLSENEIAQLAGILRCEIEVLGEEISNCGNAAIEEYVRLFLGQKVFTRGSDFREYRLFLLIQHAFNNELPNEQEVCDRFQCTVTQARSLIRSVMSKYQYELDSAIMRSQIRVLNNSVESADSEEYLITVDNENIIDALNRVLASIDGTLPPISSKRNTVSTYRIKPSSYERLLVKFGIDLIEDEE